MLRAERDHSIYRKTLRKDVFISFHGNERLTMVKGRPRMRDFIDDTFLKILRERWKNECGSDGELQIFYDKSDVHDHIAEDVISGIYHLQVDIYSMLSPSLSTIDPKNKPIFFLLSIYISFLLPLKLWFCLFKKICIHLTQIKRRKIDCAKR